MNCSSRGGNNVGEGQTDAAQPALPGLECEYDGNKSGLDGQKSGSSPAQVRGMSGGGAGQASPVPMRLPAIFYEDALKNTIGGAADVPVVIVPPRPNGSMNGNGHGSDAGMARVEKRRKPQPIAQTPLQALMRDHLHALEVQNYSEFTVRGRAGHIGVFLAWLEERGITEPLEVTRPVLERYQRHLFHHRKANGDPLSFRSQHAAARAAADVVPMDDPAELHPA